MALDTKSQVAPHAVTLDEYAKRGLMGAAAGVVLGVPLGMSARLLAQVMREGRMALATDAAPSLTAVARAAAVKSLKDGVLAGTAMGLLGTLLVDDCEETKEAATAMLLLGAASAVTASVGMLFGVGLGESVGHVAAFVAPRALHPHMLTDIADGARVGLGVTGALVGFAAPLGALVLCGGV